MRTRRHHLPYHIPAIALPLAICLSTLLSEAAEPVFSRDILPILSDRCFHCHGPDESHRKADLRLDLEEHAKATRDGQHIIKPGAPEASLVWQRIVSDDADDVMPPPDSHRQPLSADERELIRDWILGGAPWGKHWAFEKPTRPKIDDPAKHPVDALVDAQLAKAGLSRSRPAEPHTQLRRLSFGITGLPPSVELQRATGEHISNEDWESYVDTLLSSPHYGERMAMWWLDAARYSDTDGFQLDETRENWPWRDWVVRSFNANMPFDQFTREQFAGDLLPDATDEQKLATCFHRNHMTNGEGGRDIEESRIDYVIDRVNTTGTAFLGLTLGCAQCHTHKFDPISHEDYYSMAAFFNSIDESGEAGHKAKPYLSYTPKANEEDIRLTRKYLDGWRMKVTESRELAERDFENSLPEIIANTASDRTTWYVLRKARMSSEDGTEFQMEEGGIIQTIGPQPKRDHYLIEVETGDLPIRKVAGWKLEVFPHETHINGGLARGGDGNFTLEGAKLFLRNKDSGSEIQIPLANAVANLEAKAKGNKAPGKVADALNDDPRNGWRANPKQLQRPHIALFSADKTHLLHEGFTLCIQLEQRAPREYATIGRFRLSITPDRGEHLEQMEAKSPLEILAASGLKSPAALDETLRQKLLEQYLLDHEQYQQRLGLDKRLIQHLEYLRQASKPKKVQVLAERSKPRDTHILERGVWDAKGKLVAPGMPSSIFEWPKERSKTRADLADWIVHPDNPLTSRVIVNQIWMNLFGDGLVRTPEDFGLQGEQPTNPELLDWLAVELVESGWDVKHMIRLIVTSETYRQSSVISPELLELDPDNRLLARAPRFRLPAWMIRDNALAASGLLNPTVGGPPVKPWQPEGVWNEIFMGRFTYVPTPGPSQYRRTLYAFWRRSSAPTFLFDNAQRRSCEIRQRRTNTPLHALILLNDTTMLEASRVLAEAAATAGADPSKQLFELSQRILGRELTPKERKTCLKIQEDAHNYYRSHPQQAREYTTVGQQAGCDERVAPLMAAWMVVASTLLNLDEAISHE